MSKRLKSTDAHRDYVGILGIIVFIGVFSAMTVRAIKYNELDQQLAQTIGSDSVVEAKKVLSGKRYTRAGLRNAIRGMMFLPITKRDYQVVDAFLEAYGTPEPEWLSLIPPQQNTLTLDLLLKHHVDLKEGGYGYQLAQLACCNGNKQMLLKLFDSGMKPNPTLLLTVAMLYSNPQMGRFLLENGASASDRDIVSALQPNKNIPASIFYKQNFAVPFNAPESPACFAIGAAPHLLPLLLEKGANPDGKNLMGRSALILAVMKNDLKSVKILLEHNANIENDDGFLSPLALAVKLDKEPIVRFLLSKGANANGKGNPLQMAKLRGNKEMISLLTQAGAH